MVFDTVVVGALGVNCYLLGCEETRQGVVVDPGDEVERLIPVIERTACRFLQSSILMVILIM